MPEDSAGLLTCENCGARFTPLCGHCRKCGQLGPLDDIRPYFVGEAAGMLDRDKTEDDVARYLASIGYSDDSIPDFILAANETNQYYARIAEKITEDVASANVALSNTHGSHARWWRYSTSHQQFEIEVGGGGVVIALIGCESIAGPVDWSNQRLEINWHNERGSSIGWTYELVDPSVGFKAIAHQLIWAQDYSLYHRGSLYNPRPLET